MAVPYLNSWDFIETLSWLRGKHSFKAGFDYKYSEATRYIKTGSSGRYKLLLEHYSKQSIRSKFGQCFGFVTARFPGQRSLQEAEVRKVKHRWLRNG